MTHNTTDTGNAHRLHQRIHDRYRYIPAWDTWLRWDTNRWVTDDTRTIVEETKTMAAAILDEARGLDGDRRKELAKWAFQSENATRIRAAIDLTRSIPGIATTPDDLDSDPWLLNVTNGTIDLRTGQLRPHDPADMITKLAPVAYQPDAGAPTWTQFLEQVQPDPDVREFLARWAGYCCTGDVSEQKLMICHGGGANGKSTALEALSAVLGDYATQAAPDLLISKRDDAHPTGLAALQGARLVLAAETGQDRRLDEALVKRLTGGDRITARKLYQDFFTFNPTHKIVMATNHRPEVTGADHGIWRRLRLVPWAVTIIGPDQDPHLPDKLAAEAPGILSWAVSGCLRWLEDGLTEPQAIRAATEAYRSDEDTLGEFISDECVLLPGVSARAKDLHDAYERWAEAAGARPLTTTKFGRALGDRGLTKRRANGVVWDGIALRAANHHTHTMDQLEQF